MVKNKSGTKKLFVLSTTGLILGNESKKLNFNVVSRRESPISQDKQQNYSRFSQTLLTFFYQNT